MTESDVLEDFSSDAATPRRQPPPKNKGPLKKHGGKLAKKTSANEEESKDEMIKRLSAEV